MVTPNSSEKPISSVRAARHRAGLTLDVLAVRARLSRATVHWAEKAPEHMSDRTACALARVLGVKVEELRP